MPATTVPASPAAKSTEAPIRRIGQADLRASLREGWQDFLAMRGDIMFAALLYPLIGLVAATAIIGGALLPLLFPILAGLALLGPVLAIGFYELARRRENGLTANWSHFLDVRRRPAAEEIGYVSALLAGIFALWLLAAGALYLILWGAEYPASISGFLTRLFTTDEGWALIVIGNLIGVIFAAVVVAVSVVSLPMLVDCRFSAGDAVRTSVRATALNKGPMVRWGLIVAALLAVGSIPFFIGLAVVLPWLGYSTWHLYGRLVDRSAIPREACE